MIERCAAQGAWLGLATGLRRCAAQGEAVAIRAGDRAEESDAWLRVVRVREGEAVVKAGVGLATGLRRCAARRAGDGLELRCAHEDTREGRQCKAMCSWFAPFGSPRRSRVVDRSYSDKICLQQ